MASQIFQLVMRSGPNPGKIFTLTQGEIIVGREVGADIVINDAEISRKHARLVSQHGGYIVEDLGSTNGTFVNGQRLMGPHMLRHGELVSMGENVSLAFESPQIDSGATQISGSGDPGGYAPATVQAPSPDPYVMEQPEFSGQVPAGPVEPQYTPPLEDYYSADYPDKKSNKTLIYVGVGCAVVMLCVVLTAVFAFDVLDLYCEAPFDQIFNYN